MRSLILIIILLFAGCEKDVLDTDKWVLYSIPAGQHNQPWKPLPHIGNKIEFEFYVDKSWNQNCVPSGVNKISGFSYGFVHSNSARLGWQFIDGRIFAFPYVYLNGSRLPYNKLCEMFPGEHYKCTIERQNQTYYFTLNSHHFSCPAAGWLPGNVSLPYVGGRGTFSDRWDCWLKIKNINLK